MTLPDCMMPDGADPCAGYQALAARVRELEADLQRAWALSPSNAWAWEERAERAEAELHFKACLVHDLLPYQERAVKAEAERDALRTLLLKSYCYVVAHVPIGVKTDNDRKVLMLDIDAALRGEGE